MTVPPIDPIQPSNNQPNANTYQHQSAPSPSINVLAIIGFALAVTGTGCGIVSLVLSIIGYNQVNREPNRYTGKGFAIAGIIVSILSILLAILLAFLGLLGAIFDGITNSDSSIYS